MHLFMFYPRGSGRDTLGIRQQKTAVPTGIKQTTDKQSEISDMWSRNSSEK